MQNISLHIIASAGMEMSMSIIGCHFIPLLLGGNGNEIKPCFSFNVFATLLLEYDLYRARMNMEFIASYWPACLLACCLLVRLLLNYFLFLYRRAGWGGSVNRKSTVSLKTRRRSPKAVAKRKFHLLAVNPLDKNASSIAQNW